MLTQKVAVYVPTTVGANQPAPDATVAKWLKAAKVTVAGLFGGFTAYTAQGGWYSPEHGLIEEDVYVVQAFTDEAGLGKADQLRELARKIAADMGQEAVSVEVGGSLEFVTAA